MGFGWVDYLVCGLMLAISSSIGIYYRCTGGKQRTNKEFLLANNDANMWAVAFSLMATFMSSITILGVSSEIYSFGTLFTIINLSYGIFTPVAAHLYLPVFFKLKTTSAYEYLERRFGLTTRLMVSLAFTGQMVLYMGIVVYAPALALEAVTGIDHVWAVLIIGIVCTFYAGLGGMKAVLMTDVFQSILMFAAVFSIIVTAVYGIGFREIWSIAEEHGRIEFLNFNPDPTVRHTWWTMLIGGGFTFLSLYSVNQAQVQRYLSVKDLKTAQKSLYLNWPILSLLSLSTSFAGLSIFSKYYNCDPLLTKRISSIDQIMPRYVLDTMGALPGLSGLFVAGIFSGSLSTVSSALNSLSAVTMEDYIKPAVKRFKSHSLNESSAAVCTKIMCIIYGFACLAVAFIAKYLGAVLQAALTIFGVVGGPILGTFTLGMFIPMANEPLLYDPGPKSSYRELFQGALAGLIIGLCFGFWFGFGGPKPSLPVLPTWASEDGCKEHGINDVNFPNNFKNGTTPSPPSSEYLYIFRMSYQWYIVMLFLITMFVGVIVSWIASKMGHVRGPNHADLFVPPLAKYLEKKKQKNEMIEFEASAAIKSEMKYIVHLVVTPRLRVKMGRRFDNFNDGQDTVLTMTTAVKVVETSTHFHSKTRCYNQVHNVNETTNQSSSITLKGVESTKNGVTKCESKIESRAVLLSCPAKDSGCDDDDPLSQAMKAEQAQIFQDSSKNFESIREDIERGFPNAIKDCKRKLIITLKVKNSGKVPCDDEYIVVDHVFDPITGAKGRLLSPLVLKLRQEQMIQLYRLQFQRVVNSDPFEEHKETDKACSIDSDNATCGIAMYDGTPIAFSEGFCCSCNPLVNAKRQRSPLARGDSLFDQDSKLISRENNRFTRQKKSSSVIVNPELVRVKPAKDSVSSKNLNEDSKVDKDVDGSTKELSFDKIPNFLLEQDRKIVCDKGDFLGELCKLQNEKNKGEPETSYGSTNSINKNTVDYHKNLIFDINEDHINKNKRIGESYSKYAVNVFQDFTTEITLDCGKNNPNYKPVTNNLNDNLMCKNSVGGVNSYHTLRDDSLVKKKSSDVFSQGKTSQLIRGKRENREKPYFSRSVKNLGLEEKLEKFARSKSVITNHRKRLLEVSHKRCKKAEIRCRDSEECKTGMAPNFPEEDYGKAPPPKYFFSHDQYIIDPQESAKAILNSTRCNIDEIDFENSGKAQQSHQFLKPSVEGRRTNVKEKDEKMSYDGFSKSYQKHQKDEIKDKFQKVNLVGKLSNNNDGVTFTVGDKIENNICGGRIKIQNDKSSYREINSLRNDKRFKIESHGSEKDNKLHENLGKNILNEKIMNKDGISEDSVSDNIESPKSQKSHFSANRVKNVILKSDNDKKSPKPKIRNFLIAKSWERQKFRSDLSKNDKKEVSNNEKLEKDKEFREAVAGTEKEEVNERESENKLNENNLDDQKEKEGELLSKTFENWNDYKNSDENVEARPKIFHSSNDMIKYSSRKKQQFNREPLESKELKGEIEPSRENKYVKLTKGNYKEMQNKFYPLHGFPREKPDRVAFNIEVIRKEFPETSLDHYASLHLPEDGQFVGQHIKTPQDNLKDVFYNVANELKKETLYEGLNSQNPLLYYKPAQKYYTLKNERGKNSKNTYFLQNGVESLGILRNHHYYPSGTFQEVGRVKFNNEPVQIRHRLPQKYESFRYRKPVKHYYPPMYGYSDVNKKSNFQKSRQNLFDESKVHSFQSPGQSYSTIFLRKPEEFPSGIKLYPYEKTNKEVEKLNDEKIRVKRTVEYSFEPAKGFFRSELESIENGDYQKSNDNKLVHELKICPAKKLRISDTTQENWTNKITDWQSPRMKHDNLSSDFDIMTGSHQLPNKFYHPLFTFDKILDVLKVKEKKMNEPREQSVKLTSDKQRLIQSYLNAPNYVLKESEADLKGKRQLNGRNKVEFSRGNQKCEKESFDGDYSQDTAHCMRFGDLWYSVYLIKKPVVAQIVEIQLFDKHSLWDGTAQWRDLTKGKMIRIGTFLPKAEDELPTISMSFMGEKSKKVESAINPDNYLLLIPSHLSDPSKANYYPQVDGGPEEYLVVKSKDVSSGEDCNMIGTSFEAFARQPDRCAQPRGSCLKRQPVDLWREDMEARIKGKKGKYFVENFGTVPNSPVKTFTNFTGEYLALEYYGEYTSTIEIEVKADYNAIIRKGSNAQIPAVFIDSTYPKKTRIILSVLNIGLTSSYFRPRLGDCPPDLDPIWCPLEGPLVIIPPQQRHDFKLDLSGVLPPNKIHVTVQVLNQLNRKIAHRKILIKRGERCLCAFHCKCSCIGNLMEDRTCRRLSLQEYRGAGYVGSFPFRGGATSASDSILNNISIIICTTSYLLLLMGVLKAVLGMVFRRLGISGTRVIVGPRKLCRYYEYDLRCCSVLFDECGFPIHPTTCLPVQIVPIWLEFLINVAFFFLYPLRGIWFLILLFPCCKAFCADCEGCCRQDDNGEDDHRCSQPLLEKNFQSSCTNYNLTTTVNTEKNKAVDYLHYLAYKGDDDPLEEDDTEFVLQEMKRCRKK